MRGKASVAGAMAAVVSLLVTPAAHADDRSGLRRLSNGDAFAACDRPDPNAGDGASVSFPAAEVEPQVAIGPDHEMVAVWQQDRWNDGGAKGIAGATVTDDHIRATTLPLSHCAPGGLAFDRASDPWVSIGPDGTVYVAALSVSGSDTGFTSAITAVASDDHGRTWRSPATIIADRDSQQFFNDKPSITADPRHTGVAYAVWNRVDCAECNGPNPPEHSADPGWFSRTLDGGHTWSAPQIIAPTPNLADAVAHVIVVDPTSGRLYDFFNYFTVDTDGNFTDYEAVVHSDNLGATWSARHIIATTLDVFVSDPNTGAGIRTGDPAAPTAAIDARTGAIYVAWTDGSRTDGERSDVVSSRSTDHGATFSPPRAVSRDTGSHAFTPSLAVADDGTVGVSYFDFRSLQPGNTTTLPTTYWLTTMSPGETAFGHEQQITNGAFDMLQAPDAGGFFVGDYQGLATDGASFISVFAAVNHHAPGNRTDVFTRRLPARAHGDHEGDDGDG